MRRLLAAATIAALLGSTSVAAAAPGKHKLPPPPPSPKVMQHIEGFAPYQAQSFCRTSVEPGVTAFEKLTLATYPNSHSDGDLRPCETGGAPSEHYDGRAWDWGVDHRNKKARADGKSMLAWLFATDADGNQDAMFRRLGLMYVIWNKRIWGTWDKKWQPYSCHGANACHVTHIHFSFGWAGAEKKTSFWTGKVSPVLPPDYPVLTTGHENVSVSATSGTITPPWQLKGGVKYDVTARGTWHHSNAKHGLADAHCIETGQTWLPQSGGGVHVTLSKPSTSTSQWSPTVNTGHGCNTKTHRYTLVVSPTSTGQVTITLPDASRSNDSGSVKLRFTRNA